MCYLDTENAFFRGFISHVRPPVRFNCKRQSEERHFVAVIIRQNH